MIGRRGAEADRLKKKNRKRSRGSSIQEIETSSCSIPRGSATTCSAGSRFRRGATKLFIQTRRRRAPRGGCSVGAAVGTSRSSFIVSPSAHTLPADIDYGFREAKTTFGRIV